MGQKWEEQPGLVDPKSWYEGFAEGEAKSADELAKLRESIDNLAAQVLEAEKYNGWHQQACLENERLRQMLQEALVTLKHAEVFIGSREKMHPDGQALYRGCIEAIEQGSA